MDFLVCTANSDTMGINRMTTVSAKIGMPRIKELRAMAQIMFFSPTSLMAHLVIRTAAPVFSRTVPMVHPRKMTIATLLMVPEKPLFMVPSISAHGVPSAIASIRAAIRIPIAALTLHLEMRKIINRITSAKTISTYDVDIKPTLPNLYFTVGFLLIR